MTRDELIETMAKAMWEVNDHEMTDGEQAEWSASDDWDEHRDWTRVEASNALTAIEAAGYAVVPTTPTDRQLLAMETGSSMAAVYELALAHSPLKGK